VKLLEQLKQTPGVVDLELLARPKDGGREQLETILSTIEKESFNGVDTFPDRPSRNHLLMFFPDFLFYFFVVVLFLFFVMILFRKILEYCVKTNTKALS
jgi:hypothetical protein